MNTEEILGTLEELANNVGDCLYDWEIAELVQLNNVLKRLRLTLVDVLIERVNGDNCG